VTTDLDLQARTATADAAVREAGEALMRHLGRLPGFDRKGAVDLVTAADREVEALLHRRLLGPFPADAFLGEEGGEGGSEGADWRWIVDPLDGTTNFVHAYPVFAVSVALQHRGRTVYGCVHAPALRETFRAVAGRGATLDGTPIRVSRTASVADALLATGAPYNRREVVDDLLRLVRRGILQAHGIRREGSGALDLAWLAAGRLDGFWEQGLHAWDVAAGILLVEEAGGRVTGWDLGPHDLYRGPLLASNGTLHAELHGTLFL
jgi:myo-inositol-1(or 4)-monophosphatase